MAKALFVGTIFTSAFLLFLVQPLISKQILPWFGGSAAVWAVCMVFFQVLLLAGYAYSDWTSRHLTPPRQVLLHATLLAASLLFLPIVPDAAWKPTGIEAPTPWILGLLLATIGLPYFLLSTTGPLLQAWLSHTHIHAHVYRFFSLSNLASLLALLAYPFLIEPFAPLLLQARGWSLFYGVFVLLCGATALHFVRHYHAFPPPAHARVHTPEGDWDPTPRDHLLWLGLSCLGSWLLLAVTSHITQNVAAIPFLWILPLTLYLFTFVLTFESDRWYVRSRFLLPTAALLAVCSYGLQKGAIGLNVAISIPLYTVGLFFFCMFFHGELAHLRPSPRHLTRFYLMLALGGALGGILVGIIAPRVLPAYYELGIGFILSALAAMFLLWNQRPLAVGSALLALLCGLFLLFQIQYDLEGTRRIQRNFYGTLQSVESRREDPRDNVRQLYHGSIKHGEQYRAADRRREPTTYYGRTSGIGLALTHLRKPGMKVGLIGLGAGTLAVYGQPGDHYRFYELDPQVIDLAREEFTFMADSPARIDVVPGDARLALEQEPPNGFDLLAVDAFSGDSVPMHLITREAMELYLRHVTPTGVVAFHLTNRYLNLPPVVEKIAQAHGVEAVLIHDEAEGVRLNPTDWVLVSRERRLLEGEALRRATRPIPRIPGLGTWSDDFNNLFQALK